MEKEHALRSIRDGGPSTTARRDHLLQSSGVTIECDDHTVMEHANDAPLKSPKVVGIYVATFEDTNTVPTTKILCSAASHPVQARERFRLATRPISGSDPKALVCSCISHNASHPYKRPSVS